ncbi:MAG: hypothetical protein K2H76_06480, partial [Muribaculaceae bacterium]|nr:hypothetical protein [Muribaculaceae bacterium]
MKITMHMTTTGLDDNAEIMLPTLQFNFLKGLVVENLPSNYSYDPNRGVLIVRNLNCPNRKGEVT